MTIASGPQPNWRAQPLDRYTRSSPNLILIDAVLKAYFGFFFNGSYGRRPIRGGSTPSVHSWGAAIDSSYRNSSRAKALEAIDWLIANSHELHISELHDYMQAGRVWKRDRNGAPGWKDNPTMPGANSGDWLHYETSVEGWGDTTPIGLRPGIIMPGATAAAPLGECKCDEVEAAKAPEWPAFNPAAGQFGLWPLNKSKPELKLGVQRTPEVNDATLYLQGVLNKQGFTATIDGDFGAKTDQLVKFCQGIWKLKQDGIVGPVTWAKFDAAA